MVASIQDVLLRLKMTVFGVREFARSNAQLERLKAISDRVGVPVSRVAFQMNRLGLEIDKAGNITDVYTNKAVKMDKATGMVRKSTNQFRFELLSAMFFAGGLSTALTGLLSPAFKTAGLFEVISTTLELFFLPVALELLPHLLHMMEIFTGLPEPVQLLVGRIVVFGAAILGILAFLASFGLLMSGLGIKSLGVIPKLKLLGGAVKTLGSGIATILKNPKIVIEAAKKGFSTVTSAITALKDSNIPQKIVSFASSGKAAVLAAISTLKATKIIPITVVIGITIAAGLIAAQVGKFINQNVFGGRNVIAEALGGKTISSEPFGGALPFFQTRVGEFKTVPGSPNRPVPIMAHGQEIVGRPPFGGGGVIIQMNGTTIRSDEDIRMLAREIAEIQKQELGGLGVNS